MPGNGSHRVVGISPEGARGACAPSGLESGLVFFLHQALQTTQHVSLDLLDVPGQYPLGPGQVVVANMGKQLLMGAVRFFHGGREKDVSSVFEVKQVE